MQTEKSDSSALGSCGIGGWRREKPSPGKVVPREYDNSLYYPELILLKEKMLKVPGFTAKLTEVCNLKKKKKKKNRKHQG